jgi:hypothetical protein
MCRFQMRETRYRDFTVCRGAITVSEPCIDYECRINDQCVADSLTTLISGSACRKLLATSQNDSNACTDKDIVVEASRDATTSQFKSEFICFGTIAAGRPCENDVVCTMIMLAF